MLSLKGQVWPGMGKMDLANEEMKRTRNQRKPKSVVKKMRRASEGIEPKQVVMTPQFDIERIKDVYDDELSPESEVEDEVSTDPCRIDANVLFNTEPAYTPQNYSAASKETTAFGRTINQRPPSRANLPR